MQHQVKGSVLQVLEISLDPGESVLSEDGEFSWMTDSIQMTTGMGGGAGGKGLLGAVKRAAGGSTFLFNTFTAEGAPGMIAFAAKLPGTIFPIELNQEYLAHRHGFLAGTPGVQVYWLIPPATLDAFLRAEISTLPPIGDYTVTLTSGDPVNAGTVTWTA